MSERARIVEWLRANGYAEAADAIEAAEHTKRPEPTIAASEWIKTGNLRH